MLMKWRTSPNVISACGGTRLEFDRPCSAPTIKFKPRYPPPPTQTRARARVHLHRFSERALGRRESRASRPSECRQAKLDPRSRDFGISYPWQPPTCLHSGKPASQAPRRKGVLSRPLLQTPEPKTDIATALWVLRGVRNGPCFWVLRSGRHRPMPAKASI